VLLPGSDPSESGLLARVDRLEKRASITGGTPSPAPVREDPAPPPVQHPVEPVVEAPEPEPVAAAVPAPAPGPEPAAEPAAEQEPTPGPDPQPEAERAPEPEPVTAAQAPSGVLTLVEVRRLWPDIVEATKMRRRVAWMHLTQNSQVIGVDGQSLTLGFTNAGARDSFVNGGCDEILRQAAIDVAGVDWQVESIVDPSATGGSHTSPAPSGATAPPAPETSPPGDAPDWASDLAPETPGEPASAGGPGPEAATRPDPERAPPARSVEPDSDAHPDDPDAENSGLAGAELLQRELGAEVIEEIRHS
jgi:DNA polymerase-3 subunit gamma/tau